MEKNQREKRRYLTKTVKYPILVFFFFHISVARNLFLGGWGLSCESSLFKNSNIPPTTTSKKEIRSEITEGGEEREEMIIIAKICDQLKI